MEEPVNSPLSNGVHAALSLEDLRGVFLPIPTPYDNAGDVDLLGLRSNIAKWSATGISGFVMLGSTGERVNLDEREYLAVIEAASEELGTRAESLSFIVGAGQQSTRTTIDEVSKAAAGGADAVLVITPYFYRSAITQAALVDHYVAVADSAAVPVILYSMPALTGITIEPETAARLSEHENIIGIKDSSNNLDGLRETIKLVRKDFAALTGNGTVLQEALSAGACGAILAVACAAPALCLAIFRAMKSGESELAAVLQTRLTPLATAVTVRFGIGGLKAALDMRGYAGGTVRAPLRPPNDEALAEIGRCLEEAKA